MNILFLCHRIPFPPDKGEKIRAYHMLAHLAKEHTLHLGAFVEEAAEMRHQTRLQQIIRGKCHLEALGAVARLKMAAALLHGAPLSASYFKSRSLARWVDHILRTHKIDCVIIFSTAMAPYLLRQRGFDLRRVIFDMVDLDSDKWRQYAQGAPALPAWIYRREMRTLLTLEREAASKFGATLLVSPHEANAFARLAPSARQRIWSVPNGVDLDFFAPNRSYQNPFEGKELPIVMTGTMDYRPNAEGAIWFATSVFPLIRACRSDARFYIVGNRPTARVKGLANANVVVTGKVDDVRPYLAHAAVLVAPLKLARGVQNKVLEGMAMAKPVVATSPAIQALEVSSGEELWVADEPLDFAQTVLAAIEAPLQVGTSGRRYVERHHQWRTNLASLDRLLDAVHTTNGSAALSAFPSAAE
jgi:sugar transferase (PEP-CTERM/EpsH1 system associated)